MWLALAVFRSSDQAKTQNSTKLMANYGTEYQPTNTPKDDFHQQLLDCNKVFSQLMKTVQGLERRLTPEGVAEEMSKDLKAKFETLKGVSSMYQAIRKLLEAKNMAIQTPYDESEDGSDKKRELNQVYVTMKEVLAVMEVRLRRLLGLPDTWFSLRFSHISSWTDENPKTAAVLVVAGSALLGGFAGFFHAKNGYCLFYSLFTGSTCACAEWGLAASAACGAMTGAITVAVVLLALHTFGQALHYRSAAESTDLEKVLELVERVKQMPDAEFTNQLCAICFDANAYGDFPDDHQDRMCVICLEREADVKDPVRAPRCGGKHFMCKTCFFKVLQRHGDKCPVCRK